MREPDLEPPRRSRSGAPFRRGRSVTDDAETFLERVSKSKGGRLSTGRMEGVLRGGGLGRRGRGGPLIGAARAVRPVGGEAPQPSLYNQKYEREDNQAWPGRSNTGVGAQRPPDTNSLESAFDQFPRQRERDCVHVAAIRHALSLPCFVVLELVSGGRFDFRRFHAEQPIALGGFLWPRCLRRPLASSRLWLCPLYAQTSGRHVTVKGEATHFPGGRTGLFRPRPAAP